MRILQRYVLAELLRIFGLVTTGLTAMLVVVGVVGEAAKNGLGPGQILDILPYVIPSLLPFTIPATLLLTVCVVYGRMSGDSEIIAIKSAGVSVLTVLWPAFVLSAVLSLATFILTDQFIPWARGNIERVITLAMEDILLDVLRTRNQFVDTNRGIAISVARVDNKRLIEPTFRYTLPGGNAVTITAAEATLRFDIEQQQVLLSLVHGHVQTPGGATVVFEQENRPFPLPIRREQPRPRNLTIDVIRRELRHLRRDLNEQEHRQIIATAFALSQGDFGRLSADSLNRYDRQRNETIDRASRLDTEIHSRLALACSCFFFALVGCPFAVLQGKRQFLTSFAYCFFPILVVYYPIVLVTMTLAKDNKLNPSWGMWLANAGMAIAAAVVLKRVVRH
jgi:lipopolysaccharide export system permease protein